MTYAIFISLVILFCIGVPIAFAIGLSAVISILYTEGLPLTVVPQRLFVGLDSFPLLAAPLFIFAGEIMNAGAMAERLVNFARALVGHIRGSLAMVTVLTSMFFAGVSGSATADTAAVGSIMIPAMVRKGFKKAFATAVQACSGTIGPIIPPSVVMVIYGWVAGVSVGDLFLGGVVPGVLIGLALMTTSYVHARRGGPAYEGEPRRSFREMVTEGTRALPALGMPIIILGGIVGGIFTPTEAGAVAVFYALMVELIFYKDLDISGLYNLLVHSSVRTTIVMLIVGMAALLGWLISYSGFPSELAEIVDTFIRNKYILLFVLNIIFLVVGTFLEAYAAIILLVPLLLPTVYSFNIDPVHFGVIVATNLCIGMVTPPLGITLFVSCSIARQTVPEVFKDLLPMLLSMLAVLFLITFWSDLVLFLPNLVH